MFHAGCRLYMIRFCCCYYHSTNSHVRAQV